jgi:hypothetical protein
MASVASAVTLIAAILAALALFGGRPRGAPARCLPSISKRDQASSQIINGRNEARIVRRIWQGSNPRRLFRRSRECPICILDSALPHQNRRPGNGRDLYWFSCDHCATSLHLCPCSTRVSYNHTFFGILALQPR